MIVVKQMGGIGNQLFIYSTAYAINKDFGIDVVFDDIGYWRSGRYNVDKYNVVLTDKFFKLHKIFENKLLKKIGVAKFAKPLYHTKYNHQLDNLNATYILEKNHEFIVFDFDKNRNYYLEGFFQSSDYFHKYRDDLRKQFVLKHISAKAKELEDKITQSDYCAIHVRRGDYLTYRGGVTLDMSYYKSAIELIEKTNPEVKFLVFSDDIEYCRENFGNDPRFEYLSGKLLTDNEELQLMSKCKHYIIANSSYSWWAAYLGYTEQSKVICPMADIWNECFYLDEWLKIPAKFSKSTDVKESK